MDVDVGVAVAILTSLAVIAFVYHHITAFSFWSSRKVKGPLPFPIFGTNLYYLFRHKTVVDEEWRRKYGRTYGIYEGYSPTLRTTDIDLVRTIYIKNFSSFTDRNTSIIHDKNQKRWLFWLKGQEWTQVRAMVTPLFVVSNMKTMVDIIAGCASRFNLELQNKLFSKETNQKSLSDGKVIPFSKDDLVKFTLDVIASSIFGIKINTYRDSNCEFSRRAYAFANFEMSWFLFWSLIPGPISKLFEIDLTRKSKFEYFDKLAQRLIKERRSLPPKSISGKDFIQSMIDAKIPENLDYDKDNIFSEQDDVESSLNDKDSEKHEDAKAVKLRSFEDLEIRAQATFFFIAGYETSASSLSLCYHSLAHNPDAQKIVYEEIVSLVEENERKGKFNERMIVDYSDLSSLKELDAFVSETLRLHAPVTENSRCVTAREGVRLECDSLADPIYLPYGTAISTPSFSLQRDEEYWQNPMKFDASRFYPENKNKILPGSYMPFGLGPRNCAGMRFALMTIKYLLVFTLLKYKVTAGPKSQADPPELSYHVFFTQLKHTDFLLEERRSS